MPFDKKDFQVRLDNALKRFDQNEIGVQCDKLTENINSNNDVPDERFAKNVLSCLQRKRCFRQLQRVADAFIQNGLKTPRIRRQYAQSLIDNGEFSAALAYLNALVVDLKGDEEQKFELAEARGLLGRTYKQIYVHIGSDVEHGVKQEAGLAINRAIQAYMTVYDYAPEKHTWHGINSVALLFRALRDNVSVDGVTDLEQRAKEIASSVLVHISHLWDNRCATMWDSGTAMEACVALNRSGEALKWLKRYVKEPQADAFELGSTLRQMLEIWMLDVDSELGASILPILRSELLQKEGGELSVGAKDLRTGSLERKSTSDLERILGGVRYHSYKFMLRSIDRARAVARIENTPGEGYGTGFLVPAEELHKQLGQGYVLITNAHVVSNDLDIKNALAPEDTIVTFQLLREEGLAEEEYSVKELVWTSPPWKLDTTILRLEHIPEGIENIPIHPRLPLPDGEQRVYIIGHPKGGSLSFSIQDNALLDHEAPYLHYRAPTEGGSSGSPVFNSQWKLIGLHHAGSLQMQKLHDQKGTYEANEGIWIQSIRKKLSEELLQ